MRTVNRNKVTRAADVTMAQANSVQREPSMEEILASIRRIIEDSDSTRKHVDESEQPQTAADFEPELQAAIELEAFREELSQEQPRPASLAQIQAEVAREPRTQPFPAEAWQPSRDAPSSAPSDSNTHDGDEAASAFGDAQDDRTVQAENQNPRPAILSEHAGRQVAASFGELSEAFAATRRRDFDEMAEEMMRPMLQDWLDNNLPHLVERLVREEIERVARGGAR